MTKFFAATDAFEREYKSLFDFVGASAAAIWTMRRQVRDYISAHAGVDDKKLEELFLGAPKIGKFNFNYFKDGDWSVQEEAIARTALINVIALYERWIESVDFLVTLGSKGRKVRTNLGHLCDGNPRVEDVDCSIADAQLGVELGKIKSISMTEAFAGNLRSSSGYMGADLRQILVAYRAFKELRNSFMHRSELPDPKLLEHFDQLARENFSPKFARKRRPSFPVVQNGVKSKLLLEHAYFACYVIRSLVQIFDAELAMTKYGEAELVNKLQAVGSKDFGDQRSEASLAASLGRYVAKFGLSAPSKPEALLPLLRDKGLIKANL
ncbi:hypothetical protein ACFFSW_19405 [Saccharothrix longispora]|uniref:Apea-like HEPN domain-containing protein n=1 Tax=Saccharothrix longispora TaxID=33920 RepID=A0ABU1Q3T8_9PSEU|nr:hypothetical protein [Saccharothrix longispora]MDR6597560.1 hypothetical protein [Saccharothrix longispora]